MAAQLARYTVSETPRAAEFSLGIALRTAGRHDKAVDALLRALKEPGTEPPAEDVFLQLAYVHELRGAKDQELRSYLEAVRAAPRWADQILPELHRMLTPELAPALVGWFASDWETAFSDPSIDAADRLHADLFLCRVHLYSANYEAARAILDRIRKSQPDQFASIVPKLFTPDSLRAAATQEKKGDAIFALAQIAWYLRQPQALALVNEALALGLTGGKNPEAPAYQLRGEALEADGKARRSGGGILRGRQALSLARRECRVDRRPRTREGSAATARAHALVPDGNASRDELPRGTAVRRSGPSRVPAWRPGSPVCRSRSHAPTSAGCTARVRCSTSNWAKCPRPTPPR